MCTSSYRLLLVLLLCVSLCLCDARRLGQMEKKLETSYNQFNIKNDEENGKAEASSKEKATVSSKALDPPRTGKAKFDHKTDQSEWPNHTKVAVDDQNTEPKDDHRGKPTPTGEAASSKSVSRYWKVPQKKNRPREEHPGFNLDYMQPVTHPPHHN